MNKHTIDNNTTNITIGKLFNSFKSLVALLVITIIINGCEKTKKFDYDDISLEKYQDDRDIEKINIALLLPLSGKFKEIGKGMENAAIMCVYDYAGYDINIILKDTQGTPSGTIKALKEAQKERVQLILGPIFAKNIRVIKNIKGHIPMISYSSDIRMKEPNLFIFGHDVNEQIDAVFKYAKQNRDITNTILVLPKNEYGYLIRDYIKNNEMIHGISIIDTIFINSNYAEAGTKLKKIIDKLDEPLESIFIPQGGAELKLIVDAITYAGVDIKGIGLKTKEEEKKEKLKLKERNKKIELLLKENPDMSKEDAIAIIDSNSNNDNDNDDNDNDNDNDDNDNDYYNNNDSDSDENKNTEPKPILLMGTGQWMNKDTLGNHFIVGGIFASPKPIDPRIISRYESLFKRKMGTLEALCFDSVYVAALIANKYGKISSDHITNDEGYELTQGEFRFTPDGDTKRKLRIYTVTKNKFKKVD